MASNLSRSSARVMLWPAARRGGTRISHHFPAASLFPSSSSSSSSFSSSLLPSHSSSPSSSVSSSSSSSSFCSSTSPSSFSSTTRSTRPPSPSLPPLLHSTSHSAYPSLALPSPNLSRSITTLDPKNSFADQSGKLNPDAQGRIHKVKPFAPPKTSNTRYVVDQTLRRMTRRRRRMFIPNQLYPADEDLEDPTWRIVASALIQRGPILNPPDKNWTTEWYEWNDAQDKKYGLHLPEWLFEEKSLPDSHRIWRPAPLETEDDLKNNRRTTNRRLRDDLFLLVKKDREEHAWGFPQGGNFKGESLRDTLDRELLEQLGESLQVHVLGNHPHGHYKYLFPENYNKYKMFKGAKVFIYRSLYIKGHVTLDEDLVEIEDFAWVARDELHEYLAPPLLEIALDMLPVPVPYLEVEREEP